MPNLLDDVESLMEMGEFELDELLLDNKYNKALLREQLRRTIKKANEYKRAFEYELKVNEKLNDKISD